MMPLNRVDINDAYLIVYDQRFRWYEVKSKLNRAGDGTCHNLPKGYFENFINGTELCRIWLIIRIRLGICMGIFPIVVAIKNSHSA